MTKNNLLIGGAILVIGGAIAGGVILNNMDGSKSTDRVDPLVVGALQEEQNFKDWENEDKYTFCQSREEIKGVYENSTLGYEKGDVEYISEDINVFDKEKNKLFILGRNIKYKYSGNAKMQIGEGSGDIKMEEEGAVSEYYSKNSAPVRIDYNSKIINPAPERKSTEWVVINTKSRGEMMGISQDREDTTMGDAKVFCSAFNIGDAFSTPEYFSFEKACPDLSPSGGVKFSGNFKFECGGIGNKEALEIVKEYKEKEELLSIFNSTKEGNNFDSEADGSVKDSRPSNEEMKVRLQEALNEVKVNN